MNRRRLARPLIAATALLAPALGLAETRSDVYNGATCIPYPPFDSSNAVPFSHFLYGFRQSAYCHFTVPDTWTVDDLAYVLLTGSTSGSAPMRIRLCVYSGLTSTCGAERTLASSMPVNWVAPPTSIPATATGAYVAVRFPNGDISTLQYFVPVWSR